MKPGTLTPWQGCRCLGHGSPVCNVAPYLCPAGKSAARVKAERLRGEHRPSRHTPSRAVRGA
jgi:hypothetical protein